MGISVQPLVITCLYLLSLHIVTTYGCLKKEEPVRQDSIPSAKPSDNTGVSSSHVKTENCTGNDSFYGLCINNGRCEVEVNTIDNSRLSACRCEVQYTGPYCQRHSRPELRTASMAAGIAAGVLIIILVTGTIYIFRFRRNQQRSKTLEGGTAREGTPSQFSQYSSPSANTNTTPMQNGGHEDIELLGVRTDPDNTMN